MTKKDIDRIASEYFDDKESEHEMDEVFDLAKKALEKQMQEPKTGHWIYDEEYSDWDYTNYKCSCCKRVITVLYEMRNEVYKEYPYCHCGAKMVEPQESEG